MPVKTAEEYAQWQGLELRPHEAARMNAYAAYVNEGREQLIERLTEILRKLANEASGFRSMADIERHGATNMRILGDRITEAFDILGVTCNHKVTP